MIDEKLVAEAVALLPRTARLVSKLDDVPQAARLIRQAYQERCAWA